MTLILLLGAGGSAWAQGKQLYSANFPSSKSSEIKSPDGKFSVLSENLAPAAAPSHSLLLKGNGKTLKICDYVRNVDVIWAKDSSQFIVNDWAASNLAVPYLYKISDIAHPVEIEPKLSAAVKDKKDKNLLENTGHLYIFASAWTSANTIELKATGHDNPAGPFTLIYEWDIKQNSFRKLRFENKVDTSRAVPKE